MDAIFLITILIIVLVDQWTKNFAYSRMKARGFIPVEKRLITFRIAKNHGAALGLLGNRRKLLISLTLVLMGAVLYYFLESLRNDSIIIVKLSLAFILGGGMGNLIDRLRRKYVIDFFSFNFEKSPIFNLADMFIFLGVISLQLSIIFLL